MSRQILESQEPYNRNEKNLKDGDYWKIKNIKKELKERVIRVSERAFFLVSKKESMQN